MANTQSPAEKLEDLAHYLILKMFGTEVPPEAGVKHIQWIAATENCSILIWNG